MLLQKDDPVSHRDQMILWNNYSKQAFCMINRHQGSMEVFLENVLIFISQEYDISRNGSCLQR